METTTKPRIGQWVAVTRPDGVEYAALLQRYDGPNGCLAVLYTEPGDTVGLPSDVPLYEHTVQVAACGNDAPLTVLTAR